MRDQAVGEPHRRLTLLRLALAVRPAEEHASIEVDIGPAFSRADCSVTDRARPRAGVERGQDEASDVAAGVAVAGLTFPRLAHPPRGADKTRGLGPRKPALATFWFVRQHDRRDRGDIAFSVVVLEGGAEVFKLATAGGCGCRLPHVVAADLAVDLAYVHAAEELQDGGEAGGGFGRPRMVGGNVSRVDVDNVVDFYLIGVTVTVARRGVLFREVLLEAFLSLAKLASAAACANSTISVLDIPAGGVHE